MHCTTHSTVCRVQNINYSIVYTNRSNNTTSAERLAHVPGYRGALVGESRDDPVDKPVKRR